MGASAEPGAELIAARSTVLRITIISALILPIGAMRSGMVHSGRFMIKEGKGWQRK